MKFGNNNKEVIKLLAKETYRNNRIRNRILLFAVALTVMTVYSIGSIAVGRIDAEYLMYARMSGTTASTILTDATIKQAEQIRQLEYIDNAGMEYFFADGVTKKDEMGVYIASYVDATAYEKILSPAYDKIHGEYPKKADEVMLPMRILKEMEITQPKLGQEISLELHMDSQIVNKTFHLSGYYTEYMSEYEVPLGFFSKEYYESIGGNLKEAGVLAIQQKKTISAEKIEEMLYKDIAMMDDVQQFIGGDCIDYMVIEETTGGYDIAIAAVVLVLMCVSLLIYNIMHISLQKDIRNYGLMKTLGTTIGQITGIVMRQIAKILLYGTTAGAVAGVCIVLLFVPALLEERYLYNFGKASLILGFHGNILLFSVCLSVMITLLSSLLPVRRVAKMTAVDAMCYMGGVSRIKRKTRKSQKGSRIRDMAWRNVFRNKKNAILTIFSLALGFITALGSIVISRGLDVTNEIETFADFSMGSMEGPEFTINYDDAYETFSFEMVKEIQRIHGVTEVEYGLGGYARLDTKDLVWQPLLKANGLEEGGQDTQEDEKEAKKNRDDYMAGISIIDEAGIDELSRCVDKYHLPIDLEGLRDGSSVLALHFNELSKILKEEGDALIGEEISLSNLAGEFAGTLKFGGYLNRSQKGMPEILCPVWTAGKPYLLMSEAAFDRLGLKKKVHAIDVNVVRDFEHIIKKELGDMIEAKNAEERESYIEGDLYWLDAKSDALEYEKDRLHIIRLLMYSISFILVILGLFNYLNVSMASIAVRRKEFAVMESVGMTRGQLRKMLVLEGVFYTGIISIIMLGAGSGVLFEVYKLIKERLPYMKYNYPYVELTAIILLLLLICVCLPLVLYKRIVTESVVERLVENID